MPNTSINPPCPYLPEAPEVLRAASMKRFGKTDRGSAFYAGALQCAQSLWQQGLPAQSMLQINRAFSADLTASDSILETWPLPYQAMAWVMKNRPVDQFIGNPRRHFQHLATRMVEPRKAQRSARAWACWYLACKLFPDAPADTDQIANEGISEPSHNEITDLLSEHGLRSEAGKWQSVAKAL